MDVPVATAVASSDLPMMYVYPPSMSILAWGPLMTSGTHETAPHGLAPATAHPGATLGGMDTHDCPGGGRGGLQRLAGQR